MNRLPIALLALSILAPPLPAQTCPGGICPSLRPRGESSSPGSPSYHWHKWDHDPTRAYLYQGTKQIGAYDLDHHYYRPLTDPTREIWGEPTPPPIPPPCFGVHLDKLAPVEKTTLNGQEVPRRMVESILARPLTDDSGKLRVTVVDPSEPRRKQIAEELRRLPESDGFAVRAYDPHGWELRTGHVCHGTPTIYCQAPTGKVLHRQDDYHGGAEPTIAALRKAKANYDPKKDPDLRKDALPSFPGLDLSRFAIPLLAVFLVLYLLDRKDQAHAAR